MRQRMQSPARVRSGLLGCSCSPRDWAACCTESTWASSPARCHICKPPRGFSAQDLSYVVAAVLGGSVISTLFAGMLSDWMGRKKLMFASGLLFVASIPMIAMSNGFAWLFVGRLLQGCSAGLVGVVVPLYLAECLDASNRGKGTAIFQWLLTLGIVIAAAIGFYFSLRVEEIEQLNDVDRLFAFKDAAWRSIFWLSLPPGVLFCLLSLLVAESPRWLFRRGRKQADAGGVAPHANPAAGRNRTGGNGGDQRRRDGQYRDPRVRQGIDPAPQVRHPFSLGLRYSRLQPVDGH